VTTISDLVGQIERDLLNHYSRPLYDKPAASYTNVATTIQLSTINSLSAGAIIDAEFELMYVTAWTAATKTATVIRGFLGTTASSGTTSTLVRINPRVPSPAIYDTILDEVRSWDENLFNVEKEALSFTSDVTSVQANPTLSPYRLLYARPRPQNLTDPRTWINALLVRGEAVSQFSSTYSVQIEYPFGEATTVDVAYAVPFNLTGITTLSSLESIGLTNGMFEILKWGSIARIVMGKEINRLDPTSVNRPDFDQAVPAMSLIQTGMQYMKFRDIAYNRETRRLLASWPRRFNG
jgi:hypothetical protein